MVISQLTIFLYNYWHFEQGFGSLATQLITIKEICQNTDKTRLNTHSVYAAGMTRNPKEAKGTQRNPKEHKGTQMNPKEPKVNTINLR